MTRLNMPRLNMTRLNENRPIRPSSDRMHPGVYIAMIGLLTLYAVSAWILFGGDYYNDLTFAVVTGLFVMAVAIPAMLWLTWRRNTGDAVEESICPARHGHADTAEEAPVGLDETDALAP